MQAVAIKEALLLLYPDVDLGILLLEISYHLK